MFEKQGTSSVSSEATKETCQHAKTKAAVPDARFKHPNRSAAVWLVPVYNPVGKEAQVGLQYFATCCLPDLHEALSLSSGTGTGGSKKDGDFPGVWGFSPSDRSLSIHT